jgi:hypothetical protein
MAWEIKRFYCSNEMLINEEGEAMTDLNNIHLDYKGMVISISAMGTEPRPIREIAIFDRDPNGPFEIVGTFNHDIDQFFALLERARRRIDRLVDLPEYRDD